MSRIACAIAVTLLSLAASAQEFDIFDLNDFVEPGLHGARLTNGGELVERGKTFHILRAVTGGVANYAWRSAPTSSSVAFLHLADSVYRGAYQTNVKFTMLQGETQRFLPRYRMEAELGRYSMTPSKVGDIETFLPTRWLVSGALEENRNCPEIRNTHCRRRLNGELGGQVDMSVKLRGTTVNGGAILVWRSASDDGQRLFRGSLFYQFLDTTVSGRYRFRTAMGTGFERTDAFHWGVTRIGSTLSMDVPSIGTLNVSWTPTYRPATRGRRVFNEVAVFFDRTLFARLGSNRCILAGCV